jgi:hypothetical protein
MPTRIYGGRLVESGRIGILFGRRRRPTPLLHRLQCVVQWLFVWRFGPVRSIVCELQL